MKFVYDEPLEVGSWVRVVSSDGLWADAHVDIIHEGIARLSFGMEVAIMEKLRGDKPAPRPRSQCDDIRVAVFKGDDGGYLCGIKWEGLDKWGVKGEGPSIDAAAQAAVREFHRWQNG